ncbi:MAG: T9SS type A sorting domain-containing protein [Ignavibacteria bacterium]|nr:T9SS type A sorting domain-containing protein [Ignavibacteria bacterium]
MTKMIENSLTFEIPKSVIKFCLKFYVNKVLVIAFILIGICLNAYSQQGWVWQNPLPQGNTLSSIQCINVNVAYAAGYYGTVLKTTNSGINWISLNTGLTEYFNALSFIDVNTGYVVSNGGVIIKTTDGGNTWNSQNSGSNQSFQCIIAINQSIAFIGCGSSNVNVYSHILKTTNGGIAWMIINTNTVSDIYGVDFIDINTGFVVGENGTILKTTNSGLNWTIQSSGLQTFLSSVNFADANTGIAVGQYGSTVNTINGGLNWNIHNGSGEYHSVKFINQSSAIAVGGNFGVELGSVSITSNAGNNWIHHIYVANAELMDISISNSNDIMACGWFGALIKSTNGGLNWMNLDNGVRKELSKVIFFDQNTGIVSGKPTILRTTNGGLNWSENYNSAMINDMYFLNSNTGFAFGNGGTVLKTTNNGVNWNSMNIPNWNYFLECGYFKDSVNGFVGGQWGTLWKTTNSGQTWISIHSIQPYTLNDMYWINTSTGFIAGGNGRIHKTTDSGITWQTQIHSSQGDNKKITFLNSTTGFIATNNSPLILKTTNSGDNWIAYNLSVQIGLKDIQFINDTTGFVVGGAFPYYYSTLLLKTTNCGVNWYNFSPGTVNGLTSMQFLNDSIGYVVGAGGTILFTTNGGITFVNHTSSNIPNGYFLSQNYPNPFNPVTNIKFNIPKRSYVKISVFDVLGKEISVLVNEELNTGTFEVNWDASNFPSGVYFYKIETDEFSESKKMVLIK